MSSKHNEAQEALFAAITEVVPKLDGYSNASARANILKDLALAFRLTAGGAQPGGINVEK